MLCKYKRVRKSTLTDTWPILPTFKLNESLISQKSQTNFFRVELNELF